jgi:hypothetical protein
LALTVGGMKIERAGLLAGEQEHQGGGGVGGWASADDEVVEVVGHGAHQGEEMKRSIGALRLTVMAYFLISGGPFSIESIVGAAGAPPSPLLYLFIYLFKLFLYQIFKYEIYNLFIFIYSFSHVAFTARR